MLYLLFNFFLFHGYFTFEITQPMKTAASWRRRHAQAKLLLFWSLNLWNVELSQLFTKVWIL
jgi:hypothetical protein